MSIEDYETKKRKTENDNDKVDKMQSAIDDAFNSIREYYKGVIRD